MDYPVFIGLTTRSLYDEKHDLVPDRTKDPTVFNFRLYLSNGVSDNLEEVAIGNYHVRDEHNHLCWWDSDLETFVPSDKTSLDGMTDAEKDKLAAHLKADLFISGHIHTTVLEKRGNTVFLNPGSAALSKREDKRNTFAVLDKKTISIYDIDTDEVLATYTFD